MGEIKGHFPKGLIIIPLLFFSLSLSSPVMGIDIYRWRDKDGNLFFSDTPPPAGVDGETIRFKNEQPTDSTTPPKANSPIKKSGITTERRPYNSIKVIMYMTSWCGYCRKAREYLQSLRVDLVEYDIEKTPSRGGEMLSKSGGSRGVPLIDVEGIIIRGFNPAAIKDAIERRRNS